MKRNEINFSKLIITTSVLFFISLTTKIFSSNKEFIEKYYSTLVYTKISLLLRTLTGWIPFSLGDVLYLIAIIYCLVKLAQWMNSAFQRKATINTILFNLIEIIRIGLAIYVVFNLFWGLNYKRTGISSQLKINPTEYSTEALRRLTADLVERVNTAYSASNTYTFEIEPYKTIFANAVTNYKNTSYHYLFLSYNHPCIKSTLVNNFNNYFGIAGYYNPFTAEAQINTSIPRFLIPYITSHEIAHQLGYTDEDEANFVAYFVSKDSYENMFRYSAYFTLFNYANKLLFLRDSLSANTNFKALDSLVKIDETIYRKFLGKNSSFGTHYSTTFYNYYLKSNNQSKGMDAYSDVIALLIAYQKRFGEL